ncbi:hypothetical protein [Ligilactobacillus apodemi]|uniref:Uncharacterized protein n=1 Tax=Ligilactobacillus apodemi DSM 16634 = JCM 16172 TaxID=1423724 RepID=A0A0R1TR68_9LACO|nr:hypothetical protein [Ligilactobacillus apodemi]KRL83937.1 hypothetical protein FC32_GL001206 [Ligilactobacillus apodemi DSM 16634 = JCM 16172]
MGDATQLTALWTNSSDKEYFGFSIDKYGVLHFENYAGLLLGKDTTTEYPVVNDAEFLQTQLKSSQKSDLQTKQVAFDSAEKQNNDAQSVLTSSKGN